MKKLNQEMTQELATKLLEETNFFKKDNYYAAEAYRMQLDNSLELFNEDLCINDPSEINKKEGDYFNVYIFVSDSEECISIIYDEEFVYSAILINDKGRAFYKFQ